MPQQKHIINRQVLEVKLPKRADTFAVQQELSALSREQLMPIIDRILTKRFDKTETEHVQLDRLVIDLGTLKQEDLAIAFEEKFDEVLIEKQVRIKHLSEEKKRSVETKSEHLVSTSKEAKVENGEGGQDSVQFQKTPLRILAHYLSSGILPWWSSENKKSYLQTQLDELLRKPDHSFIKLLSQLRFNSTHLERFIYTFSEDQMLSSLQLMTTLNLENFLNIQQKVHNAVNTHNLRTSSQIRKETVKTIFWKAAFHQLPITNDFEVLKNNCINQALAELAIDAKGSSIENKQLRSVQEIVNKYRNQYTKDTVWQEFFNQVTRIVNNSAFNRVQTKLLTECKRLLIVVELTRENSGQEIATEVILRPFAEHLKQMQKSVISVKEGSEPLVIEQLSSQFEETDFITVQNAGLIIFWPFLVRFFQNLGLIEDNDFKDESARSKAICALQYLCGVQDEELFEGSLPLSKLLCGVSLEDVVAPVSLTRDEQEMVGDLLQVVIQRGPHWENLSVAGLRSSYLLREGSLRMRDGHWLLQVKKETHDITMERLPWSISTVKLPWMEKIILVEWI